MGEIAFNPDPKLCTCGHWMFVHVEVYDRPQGGYHVETKACQVEDCPCKLYIERGKLRYFC